MRLTLFQLMLIGLIFCPGDVSFMSIWYQSMPFFEGELDAAIVAVSILDSGLPSISICPRISGVVEYIE